MPHPRERMCVRACVCVCRDACWWVRGEVPSFPVPIVCRAAVPITPTSEQCQLCEIFAKGHSENRQHINSLPMRKSMVNSATETRTYPKPFGFSQSMPAQRNGFLIPKAATRVSSLSAGQGAENIGAGPKRLAEVPQQQPPAGFACTVGPEMRGTGNETLQKAVSKRGQKLSLLNISGNCGNHMKRHN